MDSDSLVQALAANSKSQQRAIRSLLSAIDFEDRRASYSCLRRIASTLEQIEELAAFSPSLLTTLAEAASPDRAIVNFERFLGVCGDQKAMISLLVKEPRLTETLIILFAGSQFLTEILLRDSALFEQIQKRSVLVVPKTRQKFISEADDLATSDESYTFKLDALRRFHRRELFRIGSSDLMGLLNLATIATQITYLAVSLIRASLAVAVQKTQVAADGFSVLALG
ncbi:hypothetical protein MJD09_07920, partial [bacterium]|nr:hypothetical protein [bacterium]